MLVCGAQWIWLPPFGVVGLSRPVGVVVLASPIGVVQCPVGRLLDLKRKSTRVVKGLQIKMNLAVGNE